MNFGKGFKITGKAMRLVLFLFLINLIFSLLLAIPMYNSLKDSFGQSEAGARMAEGFDYIWWQEFRDEAEGLEKTFSPSIIGKGAILNNLESLIQMRFYSLPPLLIRFGLFYIILHVFLAGGILTILNQDVPKFSMKEFFRGAGSHFFRFLGLMLFSWIFIISIGVFLQEAFTSFLTNITADSHSEVTPFMYRLAFSALTFVLLLFIQMVFDYARIKVVLDESRNVLKSALEAVAFVFRHPFSTFGLFYLILLIQIAATVIYILLIEFIPQSYFPWILAGFLLQQMFIIALIWIRCLLYSSQMEFYRYMK